MGKIFGRIDDALERRFRRVVDMKYTDSGRPLSDALEEAIKLFIEANKNLYKRELEKELRELEEGKIEGKKI